MAIEKRDVYNAGIIEMMFWIFRVRSLGKNPGLIHQLSNCNNKNAMTKVSLSMNQMDKHY